MTTFNASGSDCCGDADEGSTVSEPRTAKDRRISMPVLSVYDYSGVLKLFDEANIDINHAFRLWRYFANHDISNVEEIPDLPKAAYRIIRDNCAAQTLRVVDRLDSGDRSTTKLLIELFDGNKIEAVIMRYGHVELESFPTAAESETGASGNRQGKHPFRCAPRATLCVSSQVGCAMGCRFCATGTMGLLGNLTSGEMLEQLVLASRVEPIRNIVFMGMGEPLDNYSEVIDAIRLMTDVRVFHLAAHRICLSTVGVVPRLKQLKIDAPGISLALSLHAPTQEIRQKIVPSARAWNIHAILDAALDFVRTQKQQSSRMLKNQTILIEYVMIKNINVMDEVAHLLGQLLKPHTSLLHLNVIPYNPTYLPSTETMQAPDSDEVDSFVNVVRSYGIKCTIRQTLGQDISGACGQLVVSRNGCSNQDVEEIASTSQCGTHGSDPMVVSLPQSTFGVVQHSESSLGWRYIFDFLKRSVFANRNYTLPASVAAASIVGVSLSLMLRSRRRQAH